MTKMGSGSTIHGITENRAELRRSSIDIATQSVENPVIVNIGKRGQAATGKRGQAATG
jgi:hypothetical protein